MSLTPKIKNDMLEYRKKNFAVKVAPSRDRLYADELTMEITHNGYQWSSITLLPHEAKAASDALLAALANTNVQRRSGEEPASPSVQQPNDQPPAPERSL